MPCALNIYLYYFAWAWTAVKATTLTISSTLHPLDKSLIGLANPWHIGPIASAPANLWTNLYPIFPAPKSGNTNTFALPATSLLGALLAATSGTPFVQLHLVL